MAPAVTIIGSFLSPYVRKVLVALQIKGIEFQVDPIVPFHGDDRFSELSPLRRVPVLIDDSVTLSDSTVICEYLEDRWPAPSLYPKDVVARARARWLEEFADTRMGDVFIWRLFNEVAINPFVWGKPADADVVARTLAEDVPAVLSYLEAQIPAEGFVCGDLSIADIAIAAFFRNAAFARFSVDATRWPRTAACVERVLALDAFTRLAPYEECSLRTPLAKHRGALAEIGAPVSPVTYGTAAPRRGIMRV